MVVCGGWSDSGLRYGASLNQDRWMCFERGDFAMIGVFDGHGMLGERAAQAAADSFRTQLNDGDVENALNIIRNASLCDRAEVDPRAMSMDTEERWESGVNPTTPSGVNSEVDTENGKEVLSALKEWIAKLFTVAHEALLREYSDPPQKYEYGNEGAFRWDEKQAGYVTKNEPAGFVRPLEFGCTAVVAMHDRSSSRVVVCWSGDSLCALGGVNEECAQVCARMLVERESHSAKNHSEREHLRDRGSSHVRLECHGVRLGNCVLTVSRSLGHAHLPFLPSFSVSRAAQHEQILICGSDGLWDYVEQDHAVQLASKHEDPTEAAKELVQLALDVAEGRGGGSASYLDNTTAALMFLDL